MYDSHQDASRDIKDPIGGSGTGSDRSRGKRIGGGWNGGRSDDDFDTIAASTIITTIWPVESVVDVGRVSIVEFVSH